jgi:hypothetical protein
VGEAVARRELLDLQPRPGREAAGEDVGPQAFVHALVDGAAEGQRLAGVVGVVGTDEGQGVTSDAEHCQWLGLRQHSFVDLIEYERAP